MTSASDLEQYVAAMLGDLKSLDILAALWDMQKFVFHMQKDLIPCKGLENDIQRVEMWASIFERPEELGQTLTYNLLMNKKEFADDIA